MRHALAGRLPEDAGRLPEDAAAARAGRATQVLELLEDDREQLWQAARDGDLEAYQRRLTRLKHGRAARPGQDGPQVPLRVLVAAETEQVRPRCARAVPHAVRAQRPALCATAHSRWCAWHIVVDLLGVSPCSSFATCVRPQRRASKTLAHQCWAVGPDRI